MEHHPNSMENRRFFGRRSAKGHFEDHQECLEDSRYHHILWRYPEDTKKAALQPATLFKNVAEKYMLEIGFGGGEHLLHQIKTNPQTHYIGCDAFISGAARLLEIIDTEHHQNIRLVPQDALHLVQSLATESLDRIYLLYPDPWHKKRHYKRRFIQKDTLVHLYRILKKGGAIYFASDITDYIDWFIAHLQETDFNIVTHDYKQPFENWISTRYEQKAFREGRNAHYFMFQK